MASGMSESAFSAKENFIDDLENQFHKHVREFTIDVKKTMRTASRERAMEIFEVAIAFLTQVLPKPTNLGAVSWEKEDNISREGKDIQRLSKQLSDLDTKENLLEKKVKKGLMKLTKAKKLYSEEILGLRKLQAMMKDRIKTSQATAHQRPPQKLSLKTIFSAKVPQDRHDLHIADVKLLPGGLVLLADFGNLCVKLFNQLGQHLHIEVLDAAPLRLALMNPTSTCMWDVALTLSRKPHIAILRITSNSLSLKTSIKTAKPCCAIAAVDAQTLAVGYFGIDGIDLIDLSGRILQQISSYFQPTYMVATSDKCLVMALVSNEIAKKNLENETLYFQKVDHLQNIYGITDHHNESCLMVDLYSCKVHLISSDGAWIKELWDHPDDKDPEDELRTVAVLNEECLCSTRKGSVFVFDLIY
ncbi:hypothetical protein RRG08_025473 [Elysia crispata]|uniref:Uncharacterized protein n=1 Tax=Elysia crispata TaxID=231223 RepID=A0AAE1A725_9GAST|nr:hypothetical protein RRG08_025473 [Elysia crispata]